jgi:hypothetical protein
MSCSESDSSDLTSISPLSQERQDKPDRYRNKQVRQHSADAKKKTSTESMQAQGRNSRLHKHRVRNHAHPPLSPLPKPFDSTHNPTPTSSPPSAADAIRRGGSVIEGVHGDAFGELLFDFADLLGHLFGRVGFGHREAFFEHTYAEDEEEEGGLGRRERKEHDEGGRKVSALLTLLQLVSHPFQALQLCSNPLHSTRTPLTFPRRNARTPTRKQASKQSTPSPSSSSLEYSQPAESTVSARVR